MLAGLGAALILTGCPVPTADGAPQSPSAVRPVPVRGADFRVEYALERDVFNAVNARRLERRLLPLEWDDRLANAARLHTRYLAESNKLSHQGRGGSRLKDRIAGLSWTAAGENLARNKNYPDPVARAVQDWVASPTHARNLYSDIYSRTGVGVIRTPDGFFYFTQVFTQPSMP